MKFPLGYQVRFIRRSRIVARSKLTLAASRRTTGQTSPEQASVIWPLQSRGRAQILRATRPKVLP
jgi:hypothetical protein